MAVTQINNRILVTADNDTLSNLSGCIENVVVIAGTTSPSVQIKLTDTNGAVLYETGTLSDNQHINDCLDLKIEYGQTLHFDLAGTGTKIYLYVK
jgi:hypothetical protein